MIRIRLIHWNANEATVKAEKLRRAGYFVESAIPNGAVVFRELQNDPPAAIVIDLNRLPSQGRDFAVAIRSQKSTRRIPIVFVDGDSSKVSKIKETDRTHDDSGQQRRIVGSLAQEGVKYRKRSDSGGCSEGRAERRLGRFQDQFDRQFLVRSALHAAKEQRIDDIARR